MHNWMRIQALPHEVAGFGFRIQQFEVGIFRGTVKHSLDQRPKSLVVTHFDVFEAGCF